MNRIKLKHKQLLRLIPNESLQLSLAIVQYNISQEKGFEIPEQLNKMKYELTCLN